MSSNSANNEEIPLNSIVKVKSTGLEGILLFSGKTEFKDGIWYGIRLFNEGQGKNNGSVNGVYYFDCPPNTGVFVLRKNLELIEAYNSPVLNQFTPPQSPYGLKSASINKRESIMSTGGISANPRSKRESVISSISSNRTAVANKRESVMSSASLRSWGKHRNSDIGMEQSREPLSINTVNGNLPNTMGVPMSSNSAHASLVAATNDQASNIVNEQSKIIQELQRELADKERKFREIQCNIDDAKSSAKRTEIARKQCEKLEEQLKEANQENENLKKEKESMEEELQKSKDQYKELLQDYEILVNEFENFSKETTATVAAVAGMETIKEEESQDGNNAKKTVNKENVSLLLKEMQELKDRCKKAEAKVAEYERNDNTKMYPATRALLEMKEKKIQQLEKQLSELKLNKKLTTSDNNSNSVTSPVSSTISDPTTIVSNQEYIDLRSQLSSAEDSKIALENRCFRLEKEIENWKSKVQQQNLSYWMPRESSRTRLTTYKFM
jgi:myosin heavy subunit